MKKALRKKMVFASADVFGGGSFNIINFLLPVFLALTVGISAFWISFILLVTRLWDAFSDPLMGYFSDHTSSRFGKRRIYLIIASPLIIVGMYLLFFPYSFSSDFLRIIAVLLSYLIFTTIQTMVMIPYYSLSSEISSDYQERASYNSFRLGFSIFASIVCVAIPGLIVSMFQEEAIGYQVMSLSFGLLFGLSVLITGLFTREEISTPVVKSRLSLKEMAKPLALKPFRQYLGMFLVLQSSMAIMSGLFFFYVDFHIAKDITASGSSSNIGLFAAALMFSMQIVALPIYLKLIEKRGKAFVYRFGGFIWIIGGIILLFLPANINPLFLYLLAAFMGFGISGPGLAPHTMYGDVVDAGQLMFKDRLDGQMSGFTNFANKIAQGLGLSLVMFIIGLAGFESREDLSLSSITSQPDSAMLAIRIIMALTPIIVLGIGMLISTKYKIDKEKQKEIMDAIHQDDETQQKVLNVL